jgi:hypothetical protein
VNDRAVVDASSSSFAVSSIVVASRATVVSASARTLLMRRLTQTSAPNPIAATTSPTIP